MLPTKHNLIASQIKIMLLVVVLIHCGRDFDWTSARFKQPHLKPTQHSGICSGFVAGCRRNVTTLVSRLLAANQHRPTALVGHHMQDETPNRKAQWLTLQMPSLRQDLAALAAGLQQPFGCLPWRRNNASVARSTSDG